MSNNSYNTYQQLTSVRLVSSSNISGTYYNGQINNGVGATLTGLNTGYLSIDGVQVEVGDRILLIGQTLQYQNGIYVVNSTGNAISLFKLERSEDFQSLEQIQAGQYFSVNAGDTLAGSFYILIEPIPSSIGVTGSDLNFQNVGGGHGVSGIGLIDENGDPIVETGEVDLNGDKIPNDNYVPENFTPTAGSGFADISQSGYFKGIDLSLDDIQYEISQVIYFDTATGNDLSGDGSPNNPYATYAIAATNAQSAADADNTFLVKGYGSSTEDDMLIYPFVNVDLSECTMKINNSVSLSSQFDSKIDSFSRIVAREINANNAAFTFNIYKNARLQLFVNWGTTPSVTFTGSKTTQPEIIIMSGAPNFTGDTNIVLDSVFSIIDGVGGINDITYSNTTGNYSSQALLKNQGDLGAIYVYATTPNGMELTISSTPSWTLLNIINSNPIVNIDSSSYIAPPTLTSGATISQLRSSSLSDGIRVDYTPVNYTPAGSSTFNDDVVTAHLHGIDNYIANSIDAITVVSSTGTSSASVVTSLAVRDGNICTMSGQILFTATDEDVKIRIAPPFGTVFTNINQASGSAGVAGTPSPSIGDAQFVGLNSISGQGIEINVILAVNSGDYGIFFSAQCTINN